MPRCLRYQNPLIYNHLASQYVAGVMTLRVRLRTERLRQTTPELDRAIAHWADQFSQLHEQLPEATMASDVTDRLWQNIDAEIEQQALQLEKKQQQKTNSLSALWDNVIAWRLFSGVGALASMVFAIMLFVASPEPSISGPSYLANMVAHSGSDAQNRQENIQFVISAYAKHDDAPSRLHVQWSKDHAGKTSHPPLHLWAEDRETGKLTYIGVQPPKGENWDLTKPTWTAVANSRRLLMTADAQQPSDNNTLFSGFCLQLKAWKKA